MIAPKRVVAGLGILMLAGRGDAAAQSRAWLGLALSCSHCEWQTVNLREVFRFTYPPLVADVEAGGPAARLGIRAGDLLLAIDGLVLTTEAGARRFAEAAPNDTLQITFRRGNETRTLPLVAAARPATDLSQALAEGGRGVGKALSRIARGPAADSPVRFSGTLAGLGIEIRGSPDVTVMFTEGECGMVIVTPTARMTVTGQKGCGGRTP